MSKRKKAEQQLYVYSKGMVGFIDIDGTLINHNDQPIPHVVNFVKKMFKKGAQLVAWSQGGGDYAKRVCSDLRIAHMFKAFLDKPDFYVDDKEIHEYIGPHLRPENLKDNE